MQHAGINQPDLARELSEILGRSFDKTTIHKILKSKRQLKADEIVAISTITGFPVPDTIGTKLTLATVMKASYVGIAASNYWFNRNMFHKAEITPEVPCIPGQYSGLSQSAYLVHGNTMELDRIFDGCFVICVDYWEARAKLLPGDTVIIERTRGDEVEISCRKILAKSPRGVELSTRCNDPKQDVASFVQEDGKGSEPEGITVKVLSLVIGVYWPR